MKVHYILLIIFIISIIHILWNNRKRRIHFINHWGVDLICGRKMKRALNYTDIKSKVTCLTCKKLMNKN